MTRNEGESLPITHRAQEEFRHEFTLPEEEETPPFELEEPLVSAEPTAEDYKVLADSEGPQPGMIRIDDFHLRNVALDFAIRVGDASIEHVVKRAEAYLEFLQGETQKETQ